MSSKSSAVKPISFNFVPVNTASFKSLTLYPASFKGFA